MRPFWLGCALIAMGTVVISCSGSGSKAPISSSPFAPITISATATTRAIPGVLGTPARTGTPTASAITIPTAPPVATPPPPPSVPTAPPGLVLLQQQGGGNPQQQSVWRTGAFTAPGSWDLQWQYNCSALGRIGNLSIDVYRQDNSYVSNPPPLVLTGTGAQGIYPYSVSGTFYLVINSVCNWAVSVTTSPRPTATPVSSSSGGGGGGAGTGGGGGAAVAGAPPPNAAAPATTAVTAFGPAATPTAAANASQQNAATATAVAAPTASVTAVATATTAAAGSRGGTSTLIGGQPVITSAISTPISPIQQAQGIFAAGAARPQARATAPAVQAVPTVSIGATATPTATAATAPAPALAPSPSATPGR